MKSDERRPLNREDIEDADEIEIELYQSQKGGKASVASAVFNLTNTIIGGGILALPFAFKTCGLVLGILLLLFVALMANQSAQYVVRASQISGKDSFRDFAISHLGGKFGAYLVDSSMVIFMTGGCVGYIVIIGDIMTPFFEDLIGDHDHNFGWRALIMGFATFCIMYPPLLLRRMDSLRITSMIAFVCIIYLVGVIVIQGGMSLATDGLGGHKLSLFNFSSSLFVVLPVIGFAFTFHMNIFPIFNEMERQEKMGNAILFSVSICTLAYIFVGTFGYLTFFEETDGNVLVNYVDADISISIGKFALALVICFSYPVIGYPARIVVDNWIYGSNGEIPFKRIFIEATTFAVVTYLLAIAVPGITFVFGIIGASVGNLMVYILPPYFYLATTYEQDVNNGDFQRLGSWKNMFQLLRWFMRSKIERLFALFLCSTGIFFAVVSMTMIIIDPK